MTPKERKYSLVAYGENNMGTLMAILGVMNGIKTMQSGDKLGGALGVLGSAYGAGWMSSKPYQFHSFGEGDYGVKRNQF